MAGYQTTYDAGMSKMETMPGNHDPASETTEPWDPATDPDTGHPSAADKPHDERVPWEVVPPIEDPAMEGEPLPDPPAGDTGATRSSESGDSVLGIPARSEKNEKRSHRTHREGDDT